MLSCSCPYWKKKRPFSQKHSALITLISFFFRIFHEKPPAVIPLFDQKNVNYVKTKFYYCRKSQLDGLFFRFFINKYCSNAHINSKRRPFSNKHIVLNFFVKRSISEKHCTLMSFFSTFTLKAPAVMPIFDRKRSILSNLYYIMDQKSQ